MPNAISFFCLGAASLLALACGGAVSGGSSGAGGGASSSSAGSGSAASGGAMVKCTASPPVFPAFDKACAASADCIVKLHMVSCCGTQAAIGLNASASAAFDQAEALCEAMYPGCGCAQGPTTAEDGKDTVDNSVIMVDCKAGACATFIP